MKSMDCLKGSEDYYNCFDRKGFDITEEEVVIYDLEEVSGIQIFANIENIILGFSTLFLFTYILVSIYWSTEFRILYNTFRSDPWLNWQIVSDCLHLRNPVIRVLGLTFREHYNRKLKKDFYEKVLKKFEEKKNAIMEKKDHQIYKDRFRMTILRLEKRYSKMVGVPLYDIKELSLLEKKFESIKKIKDMPRTHVLAINELDTDCKRDSESELKSLIDRMQVINKTMIISGKSVAETNI